MKILKKWSETVHWPKEKKENLWYWFQQYPRWNKDKKCQIYKKQELFALRDHLGSPFVLGFFLFFPFFCGSVLLILFVFCRYFICLFLWRPTLPESLNCPCLFLWRPILPESLDCPFWTVPYGFLCPFYLNL